eukprot:11267247-Alexandrium_andersonii.AAC.1
MVNSGAHASFAPERIGPALSSAGTRSSGACAARRTAARARRARGAPECVRVCSSFLAGAWASDRLTRVAEGTADAGVR